MASAIPWSGLVWKNLTGPAPILTADRFRNNRHRLSNPLDQAGSYFDSRFITLQATTVDPELT